MHLIVNGVLHVVEEVYRLIEHADNHAMCLKAQSQIPLSVELQSALGELDEEVQGHPESTNHSMVLWYNTRGVYHLFRTHERLSRDGLFRPYYMPLRTSEECYAFYVTVICQSKMSLLFFIYVHDSIESRLSIHVRHCVGMTSCLPCSWPACFGLRLQIL